jgi:hypothetical protein
MAIDTPLPNTNNNNNAALAADSSLQAKDDSAVQPNKDDMDAMKRGGWSEEEIKLAANSVLSPHHAAADSSNQYEEDRRAHGNFRYRFYRYVNPWWRLLLILPIVYLYSVTSAILTYRDISNQAYIDQILKSPNVYSDDTKPLPGNDQRGWFILRDLGFDLFPGQGGSSYDSWKFFVDFTPAFWNALLLVLLLLTRDIVRFTEYVAYQMVLFFCNGIAHVVTTFPDAGGIQSSCYDPKYSTFGSWVAHTFTFAYCGDMMWSGHTTNTLLPMIMIARLIYDLFGWNFSWKTQWTDHETKEQRVQRFERQKLEWNQQMHNSYDTNHDNRDNRSFIQFMDSANERAALSHAAPNRNLSTTGLERLDYKNNQFLSASEAVAKEENEGVAPPHTDADPHYMGQHDKNDVRINMQPPRNGTEAQLLANNRDNDVFFRVKHSPYVTPRLVARFRKLCYMGVIFCRVLMPLWFIGLIIGIVLIRYHYSVDIVVAIIVTTLVASNTQIFQYLVRWLYRPYYHNYVYSQWWKPTYLKWPLNQEQINYEERVRRVAVGGFI